MTKYNHAEFNLTHQRAEIDAEERRLIDEAIAAGKVQKIPTGKSAFAEEYVWQGDEKLSFIGSLVPKSPMTRAEALAKFKRQYKSYKGAKPSKPNAAIVERREKVLNLTNQGYTAKQIVEVLGCSHKTVKNDRAALKKAGRIEGLTSKPGVTSKHLEDRRAKVLELINQGFAKQQITEALNITIGTLQSDRDALIKQGRLRKKVRVNGVWT